MSISRRFRPPSRGYAPRVHYCYAFDDSPFLRHDNESLGEVKSSMSGSWKSSVLTIFRPSWRGQVQSTRRLLLLPFFRPPGKCSLPRASTSFLGSQFRSSGSSSLCAAHLSQGNRMRIFPLHGSPTLMPTGLSKIKQK
jgi:hypothetical protein